MARKKKYKIRSVGIESTLFDGLADPKVAAAYVQDCLRDEGDDRSRLLLRALRNVARAQGIRSLAGKSESKRRLIYKALADDGNPSVTTLVELLKRMGLTLEVKPLKRAG